MKIVDMDALWKGIEELIGNIDVYLPVNFINEFAENYIVDVVPKWIPCEERLPEKEGGYLATMKDGSVQECGYMPTKYSDVMHTGWNTCEANGFKFLHELDVIAWMPLPEPYVGERKDNEID